MPVTLIQNSGTGFLELPVSGEIAPSLSQQVETHGVIAELTDASLAAKFPNSDDAQSGDLIWIGTGRDVVGYRMAQDATDAKLATSWVEARAGGSEIITVAAVGHLMEDPGFPSAGINGVIQDPLRSRAEIVALGANELTPEDMPYLVRDASEIWHIGRFELDLPAFGLDGIFFRPVGFEVTRRTFVWDNNERRLWMLEPVSTGGQAYPMSERKESNVQTHGTIAELTDAALTAKFIDADGAQVDDLVWTVTLASEAFYRMRVGSVDAQAIASWEEVSPQVVASSGVLNVDGRVQSPLRDLPDLNGLNGFEFTPFPYLIQRTPGNDNSWAIGRFQQLGTTLDDLFLMTAGFEVTASTLVWISDAQEAYLVNPDGSRTVVTTHPQIESLTVDQLTGIFPAANSASPGDLVRVVIAPAQTRYRMRQDATDARLAASWENSTPSIQSQVDLLYSATTTSLNALAHQAIASQFNALVEVSELAPDLTNSNWIFWVQRATDGSFIEAFIRVDDVQFMSINKISSLIP